MLAAGGRGRLPGRPSGALHRGFALGPQTCLPPRPTPRPSEAPGRAVADVPGLAPTQGPHRCPGVGEGGGEGVAGVCRGDARPCFLRGSLRPWPRAVGAGRPAGLALCPPLPGLPGCPHSSRKRPELSRGPCACRCEAGLGSKSGSGRAGLVGARLARCTAPGPGARPRGSTPAFTLPSRPEPLRSRGQPALPSLGAGPGGRSACTGLGAPGLGAPEASPFPPATPFLPVAAVGTGPGSRWPPRGPCPSADPGSSAPWRFVWG